MRDASRYYAEGRLRDGRTVRLRAIQPSDRDLLREGLHHLSPQSVYYRFFGAKRDVSEGELDYFTQIDFVNHVALLAFVEDGSGLLPVGTARYIVEEPKAPLRNAEVAFVVVDTHQRLGIGTVLLQHLAAIASAHGLHAFHALVLRENLAMMNVFRKSGLAMTTAEFDRAVLKITLELTPPSGAT